MLPAALADASIRDVPNGCLESCPAWVEVRFRDRDAWVVLCRLPRPSSYRLSGRPAAFPVRLFAVPASAGNASTDRPLDRTAADIAVAGSKHSFPIAADPNQR